MAQSYIVGGSSPFILTETTSSSYIVNGVIVTETAGGAVSVAGASSSLVSLFNRGALVGAGVLSARNSIVSYAQSSLFGVGAFHSLGRVFTYAKAGFLGKGTLASRSGTAFVRARGVGSTLAIVAAFAQSSIRLFARSSISGKGSLSSKSAVAISSRGGMLGLVGAAGRSIASIFGRSTLAVQFLLTSVDPRFVSLAFRRTFQSSLNTRLTGSTLRLAMPQGPDISPMDVGETITGGIDFSPWLAGATINSIVSVVATNYLPASGSPFAALVGSPAIGTIPVSKGGSGNSNTSVLQQWQGLASGIIRITITVVTSDGQTLIGWVHQPVQDPD